MNNEGHAWNDDKLWSKCQSVDFYPYCQNRSEGWLLFMSTCIARTVDDDDYDGPFPSC